MSYTVYRHISPSGKIYVGITGQRPKKRWQCGQGYKDNPYFWKAIKKYGWDNIKHEILFTGLSAEEAFGAEKKLIAKYKSNDREFGYNLSSGGESGNIGVKMSEERKQALREINAQRVVSEETRRKIGEAHKGKKFSEEHKRKISEALKGKHRKGHPHTPESIQKLKKALTGRKNPHKGYPRSEECRKKLSESNKGKPAHNRRKVVCVETGEVFQSIREAGLDKNVDPRNISACLSGSRKRTNIYHWMYFEDYEKQKHGKTDYRNFEWR